MAVPEDDSLRLPHTLACGEVWGGNRAVFESIELPGLRGVLYSAPCRGERRGGDIHYLSVCGSGLLARGCLADVAGHGDVMGAVSGEMHRHLRRSVDVIDERRVLRRLDDRLDQAGLDTLVTAVLFTYYPPTRRLTISRAGHPPGWLYRSGDRTWQRLPAEPASASGPELTDLPLGTGLSPAFTRVRVKASIGDRLLLVTDGVLEALSADGREFGHDGVEAALAAAGDDAAILSSVERLLAALEAHAGDRVHAHDDVTFVLAEVVEGPPGPAIWHVLKNRLLRRLSS